MPSTSSLDTNLLSSLPSSPTTEEDLSKPSAWVDNSESSQLSPSKSGRKGKEKQRGYADFAMDESEQSDSNDGVYPPMDSEEAETRRVQENLRRWEVAERQRRKVARESTSSTPSLVGDVARRASLLWSGRSVQHGAPTDNGLGKHAVLNSRDSVEVVPLDDIATVASPIPSPTPSLLPPNSAKNPFLTSSESLSPFADINRPTSLMCPTLDMPPILKQPTSTESTLVLNQPVLVVSSSSASFTKPPPPKPLDLPPPKTPPRINSPPQRTLSPVVNSGSAGQETDSRPVQWWHEWLCGCSEGPDRGGEHQAGRTNPFE